MIQEWVQNNNMENIYVIFIDIKKAFDSVIRSDLWFILN